jgi:hypothetical protein
MFKRTLALHLDREVQESVSRYSRIRTLVLYLRGRDRRAPKKPLQLLALAGLASCVPCPILSANRTSIELPNEAYYGCTMVIQRLEEPPAQLFVVKESDVDIFASLDDLDCFSSPVPNSVTACQEASLNCGDLSIIPSPYSSQKPSRRSSMCFSNHSSNHSSNSSGSSVCSKSLNYDDESYVSFTEQSNSNRGTARRRGSGSRKSSRRRLKKQRHVEFNPRTNVRCIPPVEDASEDELTKRWYRKDELADIKQEASEIRRRIKAKEGPKDGEELRGLHMSKKQQRRSLWVMALTCVLDEQKRQARDKVRDPETMAKLYRSFAFSSEQIAQVLGRQDADAAREIYR